jgi:hypothetical protein
MFRLHIREQQFHMDRALRLFYSSEIFHDKIQMKQSILLENGVYLEENDIFTYNRVPYCCSQRRIFLGSKIYCSSLLIKIIRHNYSIIIKIIT